MRLLRGSRFAYACVNHGNFTGMPGKKKLRPMSERPGMGGSIRGSALSQTTPGLDGAGAGTFNLTEANVPGLLGDE